MKLKSRIKSSKLSQNFIKEDSKYLQKRISGKSVYKALSDLYVRKPKHRKLWYDY
jgi:hypothetical protein